MSWLSRLFDRKPSFSQSQSESQEAKVELLDLSQNESSTHLRSNEFEMTLPGHWHRVENAERFEMKDQTGAQQLFITKRLLRACKDLKLAREAVEGVAAAKKRVFEKLSDGKMRIMAADRREANGQVEWRLEAHHAEQQVSAFTVLRANRQVLIDFSIYQYGLAKPDPRLRAGVQFTFDMIKMVAD